jgi:hypothetical protein
MMPFVDTFMDAIKKKDLRNGLKDLVKPIGGFLYDQFYVYIWIICIYNVFFIFIVLANLFLLLKLLNKQDRYLHSFVSMSE